jgi:hypothetical protein
MRRVLPVLTLAIALATLSACVAYTPVPVAAPQPSLQQRFERSWAAAAGAMVDQGVTITSQDKAAGVMRGERGGMPVTATVQTQADGSLRVSFEASAAADKDPGLPDRLSESYLRRTGR